MESHKHEESSYALRVSPPHRKIDLDDLNSNMKLIDDALIAEIGEKLSEEKDAIFSRKYLRDKYQINSEYRIAKIDGEYYAIYKGVRHGVELGRGSFGKVKLIQNLKTGECDAIKVITRGGTTEHAFLKRLGLAKDNLLKKIDKQGNLSSKNYLKMRLIPGYNIDNLLTRDEIGYHFSIFQWLKIALQIAEALKQLHAANIRHGDFVKHNLLCDFNEDRVHIHDFGMSENKSESKDHGRQDVLNAKNLIGGIFEKLAGWGITTPFPELAKRLAGFDEWPNEPPDHLLDLMIKKLKNILTNIPEHRSIKIMLLPIKDYELAKKNRKQYKKLIAKLKNCDEVVLVDPIGNEAKQENFERRIFAIKKELAKKCYISIDVGTVHIVRTSNQVLVRPNTALIQQLWEPLAKQEQAKIQVAQLEYKDNEYHESQIYESQPTQSPLGFFKQQQELTTPPNSATQDHEKGPAEESPAGPPLG